MGNNIVITGFIGTGKTVIGRMVAQIMNREFYDTDCLIIRQTGLSINEIFREMGELYFRNLEHDFLLELRMNNNSVISTGGGTLLNRDNIRLMEQRGIIFCLNSAPEIILQRISNDIERPLLSAPSLKQIKKILAQRKEAYASFQYQLETSNRSIDEIAENIVSVYLNDALKCKKEIK
jgi:shikimate kinase